MKLEKILKDLGAGFLSLEKVFYFGPQGKLLKKNVQDLWYKYCVVMPTYNVFLSAPDRINETLNILEKLGIHSQKPLGISIFDHAKAPWNTELIINQNQHIKLSSHEIAKVTIITDALEGKDLYHRKQRERKVWWRKFSKEPKRFHLTEAKKISKNKEVIEIVADFSFGSLVVEAITYQQDIRKIFKEHIDNEKSLGDVHIVEHTASLDWGCLAFLCDAYSASEDFHQLELHPKLSPYKVGFRVSTSQDEEQDEKAEEKFRLLVYLNNLLKAKGIETVVTTSIEGIKALQVPLIVTVDDTTLQNGIIKVSSQQTTLSESIHMIDLTTYVSMRCS